MDRVIFHIDANSAFLSWQAAYDLQHGASLDIRTIPSVIGGSQATRHGIVLAKSIHCKPFKIQTGETIVSALQKCPNLLVVSPNYLVYSEASKAMFDILREYSSQIQIFSIDEGFIQFSGMENLLGEDPYEAAIRIKDRIKNELGFTVSIGISSNKLLAKMASEFKKPDGASTCYPHEIKEKMWPLPVRELYGVGRATEEKLLKYDIRTIGDIASTPVQFLKHLFKSYGIILWEFANGIENSEIHEGYTTGNHYKVKGMGNSCTCHWDVTDKADAYLHILALAESVAMRLRFGGFSARVISVYIKTKDLNGYGHQRKLLTPIDTVEAIYAIAKELFNESWKGEPIRGLGLRATDLYTDYVQASFFEKDWSKQKQINKTIDEIRIKYGKNAIVRGSFLGSGVSPILGGLSDDSPGGMSFML